jgi:phage shock protein PspC (stress-responsive transcriptional regulator)
VHLIAPALSLLAFVAGGFAAYLNQTLVFLVFFVLAALFAASFLAYMLVKLYRQGQHDSTASEDP